jgi:hypothetical protein
MAVQRFAGRIAQALEGPASSSSAPSALLSMTTGMAVSFADGVQLGSHTSRTDRFDASLHHLVLTGWAQLKEVTGSGEIGPAESISTVDSASAAQRATGVQEAHERLAAQGSKSPLVEPRRPADAVDDISPVGQISPPSVISAF